MSLLKSIILGLLMYNLGYWLNEYKWRRKVKSLKFTLNSVIVNNIKRAAHAEGK